MQRQIHPYQERGTHSLITGVSPGASTPFSYPGRNLLPQHSVSRPSYRNPLPPTANPSRERDECEEDNARRCVRQIELEKCLLLDAAVQSCTLSYPLRPSRFERSTRVREIRNEKFERKYLIGNFTMKNIFSYLIFSFNIFRVIDCTVQDLNKLRGNKKLRIRKEKLIFSLKQISRLHRFSTV